MKTPEELKKGLEYCRSIHELSVNCHSCPYDGEQLCGDVMLEDALEYIEWLEKNLQYTVDAADVLGAESAKFERERDAACNVIKQMAGNLDIPACEWCKGNLFDTFDPSCRECRTHNEGFEWRGVCPENTEVRDENA